MDANSSFSSFSSFDNQLHSDETAAADYCAFLDELNEESRGSVEVADEDIDPYSGEDGGFVGLDPDFFMDSYFESQGEF